MSPHLEEFPVRFALLPRCWLLCQPRKVHAGVVDFLQLLTAAAVNRVCAFHNFFSFNKNFFYVKRRLPQAAATLNIRITKKARSAQRAQSCLILCILPAAGSAAALCCLHAGNQRSFLLWWWYCIPFYCILSRLFLFFEWMSWSWLLISFYIKND